MGGLTLDRVNVALGKRSYDIVIGAGLLGSANNDLARFAQGSRLIIVTDSNVSAKVGSLLNVPGVELDWIILPPGESTKSWPQLERLCEELLTRNVERSSHIVALGGGVIGDLVGFAASILKRGCKFIQIPTTLLSQVDSSVGGKTAINSAAGKNLIGSFHQPALVVIDPEVLDTLPRREMRAGYGEIVKYGLLGDFAFFEWCEANGPALLAGDRAAQCFAISASVRAKAAIVEADERETEDKRALLNLGHTFGHALEAATGFSDKLIHGEAVAAGMALAFRFAASRGQCTGQEAERVTAHLKACGLPSDLSTAGVSASGEELVAHMMHDKKMAGGILPFILPVRIGEAIVDRTVEVEDVAHFLELERVSRG
jgi:3-dehydroquinate synthase